MPDFEIHYDPSEFRAGSPLEPALKEISIELPGLEKLTGADFMVSPAISQLPEKLRDVVPHKLILRKRTENGILVQRKSGRDMLNSIPNLSIIYDRMREWSPRCWFVHTGRYKVSANKQMIVNGEETNWTWSAFLSALVKMQLRGAAVVPHPLADDKEFGALLQYMKVFLAEEPDRIQKVPELQLVQQDEEYPIRRMLVTLPGVGQKMSKDICTYAGGGWETLTALTSYQTLRNPNKPKGLGKKTIQNIRSYLGIPQDALALGLYIDDPRQE